MRAPFRCPIRASKRDRSSEWSWSPARTGQRWRQEMRTRGNGTPDDANGGDAAGMSGAAVAFWIGVAVAVLGHAFFVLRRSVPGCCSRFPCTPYASGGVAISPRPAAATRCSGTRSVSGSGWWASSRRSCSTTTRNDRHLAASWSVGMGPLVSRSGAARIRSAVRRACRGDAIRRRIRRCSGRPSRLASACVSARSPCAGARDWALRSGRHQV